MAGVRTCERHGLSLVEISRPRSPHPHDASHAMASILGDLSSVHRRTVRRPASAFERCLVGRLRNRSAGTWLDAFPLYAAWQVCLRLGVTDLRDARTGYGKLSEDALWECEAAGFAVAADGEDGVRRLLDRLQSSFREQRRKRRERTILGPLFKWLDTSNGDAAYEPLRNLIRRHSVDTLPVGSGERLLGVEVDVRRVHSVQTAHVGSGAERARLHALLRAVGLVGPGSDGLTPGNVTFDAVAAAPFLADLKDSMCLREAVPYLRVPVNSRQDLIASGLLVPWIAPSPELRDHVFRRRDLDAFAAALAASAKRRFRDDPSLVDLPTAAKHVLRPSAAIARLLIEGRLGRVGIRSGARGYMAVLVDPAEVRPLLHRKDPEVLSRQEIAKRLGMTVKTVSALWRLGAIATESRPHPVVGRAQKVVRPEEVERFLAEYVKLGDVARSIGSNVASTRARLAADGVLPCFDPDVLGLYLYRRRDVAAV